MKDATITPTENVYLDRPVQNGLSCGLCGSVWLCPELSRTKCFADVYDLCTGRGQFADENVCARLVCKLNELMDVLLRIISGISKNSREQLSFYSISTSEYKSVFIHIDKFIIKKFCPLSMEEFPVTMREK